MSGVLTAWGGRTGSLGEDKLWGSVSSFNKTIWASLSVSLPLLCHSAWVSSLINQSEKVSLSVCCLVTVLSLFMWHSFTLSRTVSALSGHHSNAENLKSDFDLFLMYVGMSLPVRGRAHVLYTYSLTSERAESLQTVVIFKLSGSDYCRFHNKNTAHYAQTSCLIYRCSSLETWSQF